MVMEITEAQIKEYGLRFFPQFTEKYQKLAILTIINIHSTSI